MTNSQNPLVELKPGVWIRAEIAAQIALREADRIAREIIRSDRAATR